MVWIKCGLDSCGLDKHESRQGLEEIITSSITHGLDKHESYQGFELLHIEQAVGPRSAALRSAEHGPASLARSARSQMIGRFAPS